jgi:hypothetical protein
MITLPVRPLCLGPHDWREQGSIPCDVSGATTVIRTSLPGTIYRCAKCGAQEWRRNFSDDWTWRSDAR